FPARPGPSCAPCTRSAWCRMARSSTRAPAQRPTGMRCNHCSRRGTRLPATAAVPTSPRRRASTGPAWRGAGGPTRPCGCGCPTARWSASKTGSSAGSRSAWTPGSAISSCAAPTVPGPTSLPWWWTTPTSASPKWCAAPTCWAPPRARSSCSSAWACPRRGTRTCRWCLAPTAASFPSPAPRCRWTTPTRRRRCAARGWRWDRIPACSRASARPRSCSPPPGRASIRPAWRARHAPSPHRTTHATCAVHRIGSRRDRAPDTHHHRGGMDMTTSEALVTGGTAGIGTAICKRLIDAGHKVATNYRNEERTRAWQEQMKAAGYEVTVVRGDVASPEESEAMVREVEQALGPVEILINNAGITRDGTFHKMTAEQWQEVVNTNLNSVFNVTRPVIEGMRARKRGRIIQISSINGQKGQYGQANYAEAKAGMHGVTISLAQENARVGITVNTVSPGYIGTDMVMAVPEDVRAKIVAQIPTGRLGEPDEIAYAVSFFIPDEASWITGANLSANGGQYMGW